MRVSVLLLVISRIEASHPQPKSIRDLRAVHVFSASVWVDFLPLASANLKLATFAYCVIYFHKTAVAFNNTP